MLRLIATVEATGSLHLFALRRTNATTFRGRVAGSLILANIITRRIGEKFHVEYTFLPRDPMNTVPLYEFNDLPGIADAVIGELK